MDDNHSYLTFCKIERLIAALNAIRCRFPAVPCRGDQRAQIDCVEFSVLLRPYEGTVRVPRTPVWSSPKTASSNRSFLFGRPSDRSRFRPDHHVNQPSTSSSEHASIRHHPPCNWIIGYL